MTITHMSLHSRGVRSALRAMAVMLVLIVSEPARAQSEAVVEISSPREGDVLTGVVEVRGTVSSGSFLSAELAFAYSDGTTEQWFGITELPQPATNAQLALWDTTAISDGAYTVRLRLNGTDGTVRDDVVQVQVRNYTAAPVTATASSTPTSQPILEVATPVVIAETPTESRPPAYTPTPFPANPVDLTPQDVWKGFARGGFAILAVFFLWGAVTLRRRA